MEEKTLTELVSYIGRLSINDMEILSNWLIKEVERRTIKEQVHTLLSKAYKNPFGNPDDNIPTL